MPELPCLPCLFLAGLLKAVVHGGVGMAGGWHGGHSLWVLGALGVSEERTDCYQRLCVSRITMSPSLISFSSAGSPFKAHSSSLVR